MAETKLALVTPSTEDPSKNIIVTEDRLMSTVIPEEFRDKPYLKDIGEMKFGSDAIAAVFKKLDGSQQLIGKKTGVPAADASTEEWDKFYVSTRPEKAGDYEVKAGEGADEAFITATKQAFFDAGMSKHQADKFQVTFFKGMETQQTKQTEERQKLETDFEKVVKDAFGDENKAVHERVKVAMKEHTPENLRPHLEKLSNENLAIMMGVINATLVKYVPEDELTGGGGSGGGESEIELRERGRTLMSSKAYTDPYDPKHDETKKEVNDLYLRIDKMDGGKKK